MVEEIVPDFQCGFSRGRGCIDMISCVTQLVEKSREHNTNSYMLFVDLRKAYDSIPRQALWTSLHKYGVPPVMINPIKSLHDGMKAEVSVDGKSSSDFEVMSGLREGCTIAQTLFKLYFNMVINCWRDRCQPFGVDILYKCGGKLVGEKTWRPSTAIITELLVADDAAAVSNTRQYIERAAAILEEVTSQWGLTISFPKTKLMIVGPQDKADTQPIIINRKAIEVVSEFKYLGAIVESSGDFK